MRPLGLVDRIGMMLGGVLHPIDDAEPRRLGTAVALAQSTPSRSWVASAARAMALTVFFASTVFAAERYRLTP